MLPVAGCLRQGAVVNAAQDHRALGGKIDIDRWWIPFVQ
jgi:hypothetical protein